MALSGGRSRRDNSTIWPGFVDGMTTLLMILMFVLSIFMILQFTLRETITTQDNELDQLTAQVAGLADALGLERDRASALEADIAGLEGDLAAARSEAEQNARLIATLTSTIQTREAELAGAQARITSFEAQVASLLAERDAARGEVADLTATQERLMSEQEALNLALARAREEVDAQAEAARLAAARREALEALMADLRRRSEEATAQSAAAAAELSEAEAARLAEAEAARLLRERLQGAEDELTAMTLALEEQRRKAEETLTLLAAAEAARRQLEGDFATRAQTEAERQAALLATAEAALAREKQVSAEGARKVALLNEQVAALRSQLGALEAILDESAAKDAEARVQIESLGTRLNAALAQVAAEERRRLALEEAERRRLEEEAAALRDETKELARYRSEFFGKLSEVLAGREGVRVVGDRFVFSSEVLFEPASADLAPEGRAQIAGVVATLQEVAAAIPPEVDWIIRVDGHTDATPLSGGGRFTDNWELSQARALSVVRYMQDELGFPPERMAAAGFGEYQPVAEGDSPEALAANRRIELKLTDR